jgi:hypothetical protein
MLLYLKLGLQILILQLIFAILADSRGDTVHPLQLSGLFVAASFKITIKVGL